MLGKGGSEVGGESRVVVALLLVQLFFGIHYVAAKMVVGWVSPAAWILFRVGAAALILTAWVLLARKSWPRSLRQWGMLAAFAFFGVALNQVLFMEGIARTTPAHSALIQTAIPLWVVAFGLMLRRERLTLLRTAGLLLALLGVLVLLRADQFRLAGALLAGDLLCLANTASYGFFLVISKRYLDRHDPLTTTAHIFLLGTLPVAVYGLTDFTAVEWGSLPANFWGWAAFIVIFSTVGTYFLIYWALRRVPSSVVALFIYLQPVIATVLDGWLREVWPSPRFYPAAALVFLGVGLGVRGGRAPQPAPAPSP